MPHAQGKERLRLVERATEIPSVIFKTRDTNYGLNQSAHRAETIATYLDYYVLHFEDNPDFVFLWVMAAFLSDNLVRGSSGMQKAKESILSSIDDAFKGPMDAGIDHTREVGDVIPSRGRSIA